MPQNTKQKQTEKSNDPFPWKENKIISLNIGITVVLIPFPWILVLYETGGKQAAFAYCELIPST